MLDRNLGPGHICMYSVSCRCVPCDSLAGNEAVTAAMILMEDCHRKLNKVLNNCASSADLLGYQLYVTVNLRQVKDSRILPKVNIVLSRPSVQLHRGPAVARLVMRVIYVPCKTYRVLVTSPVRGVRRWREGGASTAVPTARWWGATTTKPANELRLFYCFI